MSKINELGATTHPGAVTPNIYFFLKFLLWNDASASVIPVSAFFTTPNFFQILFGERVQIFSQIFQRLFFLSHNARFLRLYGRYVCPLQAIK